MARALRRRVKLRYRKVGDRYYVRIVDDVPDESRVWKSFQMMGTPLEVDRDPRALSWSRYVKEAAFAKLQKSAQLLRATLEPEPGEAPVIAGRQGEAYAKARPVNVPALLKLMDGEPAEALAALRAGRTELAVWARNTPEFAIESRKDLAAIDEALDRLKQREREVAKAQQRDEAREISAALRGVSADDLWKAQKELLALKQRAEAFETREEARVEIPETIPGFQGRLRSYQREGVGFLVARGMNAILADEMGLGKTIMAIAAVLASDQRAMVVGPANVLYNWADEVERFSGEPALVYHQQRWMGPERARFLLTTYDALRNLSPDHVEITHREVLILDEAHYIRNPETQRAKMVKALPQKRRVLLTGTPLVNGIEDYYELLEQVDPVRFTSRAEFSRTWKVDASLFNRYGAVRNLAADFLQRATRDVLLRRRKDEVLAELPPRTITITKHEMDTRESSLYRQLEHQAAETVRRSQSDVAIFAAIHTLRQHLALARVEPVRERVRELLDAGEAVIVYSHYLEPLRKLHAAFAKESAMLDGSTPPKRRQELATTFGSEDGPQVLLAQMEAGGIGLNFTAARFVLFLHLGWTPAVHAQAMDRVHRIGQDRPVQVEFFVTPDTIDERMVKILLRKEADQNLVLDEQANTFNRGEIARLLAEDAAARDAREKEVAFG